MWQFRKAAQASRLVQSSEWLLNRIAESARLNWLAFKVPKRKVKSKTAEVLSRGSDGGNVSPGVRRDATITMVGTGEGESSLEPGEGKEVVSSEIYLPTISCIHGGDSDSDHLDHKHSED